MNIFFYLKPTSKGKGTEVMEMKKKQEEMLKLIEEKKTQLKALEQKKLEMAAKQKQPAVLPTAAPIKVGPQLHQVQVCIFNYFIIMHVQNNKRFLR